MTTFQIRISKIDGMNNSKKGKEKVWVRKGKERYYGHKKEMKMIFINMT